jgi:N-acyl-D-amino-acid deacylase
VSRRALTLALAVALLFGAGCDVDDRAASGVLFVGALVVDGTGASGRVGDVRVQGDRIVEIGDLDEEPGEEVVDAGGLVLSPGFIDTHSHHDRGLSEMPDAIAAVSQGITTVVVGQDGGSPLPIADFFDRLEAAPAAVNVAAYAGHNSIRHAVMGDDYRRTATEQEIEEMRALLRRELAAGALGLSTGLEYDPGIYSSTDEVVELAREVALADGRYISHMRSEDRAFFDALNELLAIGRETGIPVQVSHMKLAMKSLWGRTDEALALLDDARAEGIDVTADVYPYEFWQSTMTVLFPDRTFTREAATFALGELAPPEGMIIAAFEPDTSYVGMTLSEVASARDKDAVTVYLELIAEARATGGDESIIARSMTTEDVAALLSWPYTSVSSDGGLAGRHPRGYGAFTRVLARHVRERGDFSLEEAIRKMTSLSARNTGLTGRGTIEPGGFADLVLFDPETVADRATPQDPNLTSEGIVGVWVNGVRVYGGSPPTVRPGRVLRRAPRG